MINSRINTYYPTWIGLNDINEEGIWEFSDQSVPYSFNLTSWESEEPNDWMTGEEPRES